MSNAIVFDTDILIDAGRGIKEALDCLQQYEHQMTLAISIVTKMELVVGCSDKRELRYTEALACRVKFSPGFTWGYLQKTPTGLRFLKVPQFFSAT